jgi:hypothetical protein
MREFVGGRVWKRDFLLMLSKVSFLTRENIIKVFRLPTDAPYINLRKH